MAQKTQILLVDDLDGGQAEESVTFALDGQTYEIDLSSQNAKMLREALAPFVDHARRARPTGRAARQGRAPAGGGRIDRDKAARIRTWARSAGKPVSDRGRIPAAIVADYESRH
ncbi:histone-like nucleoid-structuring protein Lsr2 [Nocardiopsis trehalosi]|jgi:hypothetical protein|uniref:histone-like nucleoid-structuring protein Lsr2 n=1 Tax=Nocardiopsis trehalosi TaxID=109329 RepID=UPI00082A5AE1|nr:Lsr2 family protein [Nocardiopsis trehalosi]